MIDIMDAQGVKQVATVSAAWSALTGDPLDNPALAAILDALEGAGGNGLQYITTLGGQPTESTGNATLATVATTPALEAGTYLLKFTAMTGSDSYAIRVAYRINGGSDLQPYAGTFFPNKPYEFAVKTSVGAGDTISLRACVVSYGYGAYANLEIWRIA